MEIKINKELLHCIRGVSVVVTLAVTPLLFIEGAEKADCQIGQNHVHKYKEDYSGRIYCIDSEYLKREGCDRTDAYVVTEGQEELYKYLDINNVMRVEDNLEYILNAQENNKDFTEYRYSYIYMKPIPYKYKVGSNFATSYRYTPVILHSWTTDPNHSGLTGET